MKDLKQLTTALSKFNKMYERVTIQERSIEELKAVTKYGILMVSMFPDLSTLGDEFIGRMKALEDSLTRRENELI